MIRLLPSYNTGFNSPKTFLQSGGLFHRDTFELLASFPSNVRFHGFLDDRLAYVTVDAAAHQSDWSSRLYDYQDHRLLDRRPPEQAASFAARPTQLYYPRWPKTETVLLDKDGEVVFTHEEFLGHVHYESATLTCHVQGQLWTCVDISARAIRWQRTLRYFEVLEPIDEHTLIFLKSSQFDMQSTLLWIDLRSGETLKTVDLPYALRRLDRVVTATQDRLFFSAVQKGGELFSLYFDLKTDALEVIPQRKGTVFEYSWGYDYLYSFTNCGDLDRLVIEDPTPYEKTFIRRFDVKTSEPVGEIFLPDAKFVNQHPTFRTPSGQFGAFAVSRLDWPGYGYLAFWDEVDFLDPDPAVEQEDVFVEIERLGRDAGSGGAWSGDEAGSGDESGSGDEAGSVYTVSVPRSCESYFQLHRQLSIGVCAAGRRYGFYLSMMPDQEFDPDFSGKILCDVSNHRLTPREQGAVRHLCDHLTRDLAFEQARSAPADPEKASKTSNPIVVEAVFG